MKTHLKITSLIGACLYCSFWMFLQAQEPYRFTVPVAPGATVVPLIPDMPHRVPMPARPMRRNIPPPYPPPNPPPNLPPFEENNLSLLPRSPSPLAPERALDLIDFWFGSLPNPAYFPDDKIFFWFGRSMEADRQIREIFFEDIMSAMRGELNYWRETPKGRLALVLLLDQFPRRIFRNQPQSFLFDQMARALVLEGIKRGDDKYLYPIERAFFYLPLEHSEDPQMQALSVASFRRLLAESPPPIKPQIQAFLQYAILHQQQISRFGRFPHRNAILGRESSPEEIEFLNQWESP